MVNGEIIYRLASAFNDSWINGALEFIAHTRANEYFRLEDCETELDVKCKGINKFLGTDFTEEDIALIYDRLGNCVNHDLTVEFINSGYDMSLLERGDEGE